MSGRRRLVAHEEVRVGDYALGNGREYVITTLDRIGLGSIIPMRGVKGTREFTVDELYDLRFHFERAVNLPTGIGAVIGTKDGVWVKIDNTALSWVKTGTDVWKTDSYFMNLAFEVLSEGVEP